MTLKQVLHVREGHCNNLQKSKKRPIQWCVKVVKLKDIFCMASFPSPSRVLTGFGYVSFHKKLPSKFNAGHIGLQFTAVA